MTFLQFLLSFLLPSFGVICFLSTVAGYGVYYHFLAYVDREKSE